MAAEIVYYNPELLTTPTHIVCPKCHSPTNTNVELPRGIKFHEITYISDAVYVLGCHILSMIAELFVIIAKSAIVMLEVIKTTTDSVKMI
ncbi:CLUMA_CG014357, isoform B [Clunio marinus]|uniref:CLUMA_CG014357, isoform B n=1 Tax=Clunio marinus TaxID=568069 RepID=A0A1J1ILT0_9DIPT|nr:CLUMA_CG014357, isoform B [Clunio marinus]